MENSRLARQRPRVVRTQCALLMVFPLLLLLIANGAGAEIVTIEFGGQISFTGGLVDGLPALPFSVGDAVVATITFDSETPPYSGSVYPGPMVSTISVGGLEISYDAESLTATCNVAAYCAPSTLGPMSFFTNEILITATTVDNSAISDFIVNMVGWFPADPNAFDFIMAPMFEIYLVDPAGSPTNPPIPTNALPTEPYDISAIAMKTGMFRWIAPPSSGSTTNYVGHYSIDSMTVRSAPPVPSMSDYALILLAAILIVAGFLVGMMQSQKTQRARLRLGPDDSSNPSNRLTGT